MHNTVNKLKSIFIASFCLFVASCSSGGSGSTEGVNITGRWVGTLIEPAGQYSYNVAFDFSQFDTVGVPGNSQTASVIYGFSIQSVSTDLTGDTSSEDSDGVIIEDFDPEDCLGASVVGDELTINAAINPATLTGDGFAGVVINNTIQGQFVNTEVGCGYGGELDLRRQTID